MYLYCDEVRMCALVLVSVPGHRSVHVYAHSSLCLDVHSSFHMCKRHVWSALTCRSCSAHGPVCTGVQVVLRAHAYMHMCMQSSYWVHTHICGVLLYVCMYVCVHILLSMHMCHTVPMHMCMYAGTLLCALLRM